MIWIDEYNYWAAAAALGFLIAWTVAAVVYARKKRRFLLREEALRLELDACESELSLKEERFALVDAGFQEAKVALASERDKTLSLATHLAGADERNRFLEESLASQSSEFEKLQVKLTADFENLATRILEDRSKSFTAQNRESLDTLLGPLGEKISSFQSRVDQSREADIKDRAALVEQLRSLKEMNQRISQDAQNLTSALKGQAKMQGNWGEVILERVLEKSGLVAGREFKTQVSLTDDSGKRFQPDLVINLPDNKHLIVDSKVSLLAFERYVNADEEAQRRESLKAHVESMKRHISDLSSKNYESLEGLQSPDFVLMFVPIEPAFSAALEEDDSLFDLAFRQNVVLVTPSTLLVTLRTVANVWRQEKQAKNAQEIARRSGDLYDKFVGFIEDLEEIGRRIGKSQEAYSGAMNKLSSGAGNLVRRVEQLKTLGAQAKKTLPDSLLEESNDE